MRGPTRNGWRTGFLYIVLAIALSVAIDSSGQQPPAPTPPPTKPPPTIPDRIREAIESTPPRGPTEPGMRDPEVQKRFDELRKAGVPLPSAKYIKDLPPDIRGMFPQNKWNQPVPEFVEDPFNPGTYRFEGRPMIGTSLPEVRGQGQRREGKRFDWMTWWEVNRENYWPPPRKPANTTEPMLPQRDAGPVPERVRAAVAKATESTDPAVRAQAALALAMVKHPQAMQRLPKLVADENSGVGFHAWAAVGLLNTQDAREFLGSPPKAPRDIVGWTMAVGLSEEPTEAVWKVLPEVVDDASIPEAHRLAFWALRMHRPPGTREMLLTAVDRTMQPALISEIFRGMARIGHRDDVGNLVQLARGNPGGVTWATIKKIQEIKTGSDPTFEQVARLHERILSTPLIPGKATGAGPKPAIGESPYRTSLSAGLAGLRDPAMAAIAEIESPDGAALDALRSELRYVDLVRRPGGQRQLRINERGEPVDNGRTVRQIPLPEMFNDVQPTGKPTALIALGRLGLPDNIEQAVKILRMNETEYEFNRLVMPNRNDPFRDDSAVAIGLYLNKGGIRNEYAGLRSGETGQQIRPAADVLFLYYQDRTELLEVRAACALAIGLSGNPQFATRIKQGLHALKPGDEIAWGFAIWALGMLGDPAAVELAGKHIGPARQRIDVEGFLARPGRPDPMSTNELIARRAAVDGLAALADSRALPILYGEWGKNPFLDLEVARAIARCLRPTEDDPSPGRLHPYIEAMIRLAVQDRNTYAAASAVTSLGAIYEQGPRKRLGELVAGAAPAVEVPSTPGGIDSERVLSLGNPFYYLVLRRENQAPQAPVQRPPAAPLGL